MKILTVAVAEKNGRRDYREKKGTWKTEARESSLQEAAWLLKEEEEEDEEVEEEEKKEEFLQTLLYRCPLFHETNVVK